MIRHPLKVSQPGQSRLRPSNEHCFIVRVPGAKGCPGCEISPPLGGFHTIQGVVQILAITGEKGFGRNPVWQLMPPWSNTGWSGYPDM